MHTHTRFLSLSLSLFLNRGGKYNISVSFASEPTHFNRRRRSILSISVEIPTTQERIYTEQERVKRIRESFANGKSCASSHSDATRLMSLCTAVRPIYLAFLRHFLGENDHTVCVLFIYIIYVYICEFMYMYGFRFSMKVSPLLLIYIAIVVGFYKDSLLEKRESASLHPK